MIQVAIIGTGGMANTHANAFNQIEGAKLVACCDVDAHRAQSFAEKHGISQVFTDLDEMLASTSLDAVSNVTPDRFHHPIALKVLAKGKHILSEKPLAENAQDAQEMAIAAAKAGVVNMVNLSYRQSAALYRAHELVQNGNLGRIIHFEADYLQSWLVQDTWGDWKTEDQWLWRLSKKHGSNGVLGDIGVHIFDLASFPIGGYQSVQCKLKTFDKAPNNQIGAYTLDANDSFIAMVEMENGALGTVQASRWATGYHNTLHLQIHGEKGAARLVLAGHETWDRLEVCRGKNVKTAKWKREKCPPVPTIYQRFITAIATGQPAEPDFARGAQIQAVLDACATSDEQKTWVSL